MVSKKEVDDVTVSVSTIMLLLGVEQYAKEFLYSYSLLMMIVGLVLIVVGPFLLKDLNAKRAYLIIMSSAGLVLIVTGADYFLEQYAPLYAIGYIIFALLIFQYHDKLSDLF